MIPLIKSTFYKERKTKKQLARFIGTSSHLSFGAYCQKFEKQFARIQKTKYCIMVNSGSSANLALIQALLNLGILKKGDKVGFSSVTWSTNVMPLLELGLIPVAIDVSLQTLNISPHTLQARLKQVPLKALFLTNLLGLCDEIDHIKTICKTNNIILLEDNCESLGSVYKKTKLGNFGLASSFSFYVGHHLSTIEGGAICTNDKKLALMLRLVRAHGWDRNLSLMQQKKIQKRFHINNEFYSRYTFYDLGYNLRPTEINGFLGLVQLPYLEEIIVKREKNFKTIIDFINKCRAFYPISYSHMQTVSGFSFPMIAKNKSTHKALVRACKNKIEIRPIVGGNMLKQPFYKKAGIYKYKCPNAQIIHENGLYMGNNPELSHADMMHMMHTVSDVIE